MANRVVYGHSSSSNGWPMVDEGSCTWVDIPGTSPIVRIQIQNGQPLAILRAFVADINAYVEHVRDADTACWTATNSVDTSNHLSGTAVDIDWDSHPFRAPNAGWTMDQIVTIRQILDYYEGTVFWGNDWDDPKDAMHFQLASLANGGDINTFGNPHTQDFINRKIRSDGFSKFRRGDDAPSAPAEMTVPLVHKANGRWGSPNPAWDHLIQRESSGDPEVIQNGYVDVNTGGNEAEGLFQITPKTWRYHNGTDFAPSARFATPQQQAIVAARIFTRNPSGSDWGAGLPGRENASQLAAGLVPVAGTPAQEEDDMTSGWTPQLVERAMILLENQTGVFRKSASPLRHWGEKEVNTCGGFAQTADGLTHPQFVLMAARFGHIDSIDLIAEVANGDLAIEPDRAEDKKLAQAMLKDLEDNYPHALQMYIDAKGHAA